MESGSIETHTFICTVYVVRVLDAETANFAIPAQQLYNDIHRYMYFAGSVMSEYTFVHSYMVNRMWAYFTEDSCCLVVCSCVPRCNNDDRYIWAYEQERC